MTMRMRPRGRFPRWGLAIGLVAVTGCSGDTLFDPATPGEGGPLGDQKTVAVRVLVDAPVRMELTDQVRVTVSAVDHPAGGGVVRTGFTAIIQNVERTEALALTGSETFAATGDTVTSVFTFALPVADGPDLPETLLISVFGLAFDIRGACSAGVGPDFTDEVGCEAILANGTEILVASTATVPVEIVAVRGRTSLLPGGGTPADLAVDRQRSRVYVSNLTRNRIHTLDGGTGNWTAETFVGAHPWGVNINSGGDSLVVANSGGTSISYVSLSGTPREDVGRRLITHNTPLFEIMRQRDEVTGLVKLEGVFIDFSDRPQFIAEDSQGRLLYSTRPTEAAQAGTIRVVTRQPGWPAAEGKILILLDDIELDTSFVAIAHVDSITRFSVNGASDRVEIYDHRPGFPDVLVRSGILELEDAVDFMVGHPDSDIVWGNGRWRMERLALRDTTYVAASADRRWVAFGANIGPITMWDASASRVHSRLLVADLVGNASERVTGVTLNRDGSLGAARGQFGSYYWNTSLRLLGSVGSQGHDDITGTGVALHPDHPSFPGGVTSSETTLAFVGRGDHTIRILDTVHFRERGTIDIRDNVVGPLRAAPPLPTDNNGTGSSCAGPDCVVVKLYGITSAGGVVVIDVRRRDIGGLQ